MQNKAMCLGVILQTPRGSDPRLLQEVGDLFVRNLFRNVVERPLDRCSDYSFASYLSIFTNLI